MNRIRFPRNGYVAALITGALGVATGCQNTPDPPMLREPIPQQIRHEEPQLQNAVFRPLLDFESSSDMVFVRPDVPASIESRHAHTGRYSLSFAPSTKRVTMNLSSMMASQKFPGQWMLIGGYFYSTENARITIAYEPPAPTTAATTEPATAMVKRTIALIPGRWTPVMIDISHEPQQTIGADFSGQIVFTLDNPRSGPVWCDDVLLVDNTKTWVEQKTPTADASTSQEGWTVRQRGFQIDLSNKPKFAIHFTTPEMAETGWRVDEANELRARFSGGKQKMMVVYWDGRQIIDGKIHTLAQDLPETDLVAEHEKPATLEIAPEVGRVDRNTPGDANNDGYNETLGAYQVVAGASVLDIKIIPAESKLISPVLEIAELPKGKLLVTMEGKLISQIARTDNNHILIQLPGQLDRPTIVNIAVQPAGGGTNGAAGKSNP